MNRVPRIFRERVAALWKCCERSYCDKCYVRRRIPDCEWTRISRKRRIEFHIGTENGKWIYGFGDPEGTDADRYLTMAELKNHPDLKNVAIYRISVFKNWRSRDIVTNLRPLDVDMERLMKFVTFLSNEPRLLVTSTAAESFNSPQGSTLFQFLKTTHFSYICILSYEVKYNRLLKRQYSRRKPTPIEVMSIASGREFLEAELAALRLWKCRISGIMATSVMDAIIGRFLENSSQFGKGYSIECGFSDKTGMDEKKMKLSDCETKRDYKFHCLKGKSLIVKERSAYMWSLCV